MKQTPRLLPLAASFAILSSPLPAQTLKVFVLAGQSNMEGQALTYTTSFNVPTMEFLLTGTPEATTYLANMPFDFKSSLTPSWLAPRADAWCVHYDSQTGNTRAVVPGNTSASEYNGIGPLSPGFGANPNTSTFGPELAMGIRIADSTTDPVFLFKSDRGGTTLAEDWRPPSAVAARGGVVGSNYTMTVARFRGFLDALDADLAGDGVLNNYGNATDYEICGFFWLQGFNESVENFGAFIPEYQANLVDLIHDVRAADNRIPADLPFLILESSDQNAGLNTGRINAVATIDAEIPGSAAFFETENMINGNPGPVNWGNNPGGSPFSTGDGFHFHNRAENFLELGWIAGGAVLDNDWLTASDFWLDRPVINSVAFNQADISTAVNEPADTVTVYWGTSDSGPTATGWDQSANLGSRAAGAITAIMTGLIENTTYHFRVRATSASLAAEAWSAPGSFTTPWENPPPLAGVPITTAIFADGATVTSMLSQAPATANTVVWAYDDQGESNITTWQNATGGGSATLGPANPGDTLSHTITGLDAKTRYTYRFFTTGATGFSWSVARSFPTGVSLDGVITPIQAVAANSIDSGRRANKLIDGSGLAGSGDILSQTHANAGNSTNDYFLGSATNNEIVFTLPAAATVAEAHIWQYDRFNERGFKTFDISFSTDGGVTYPTTIAVTLARGTGAPTPVRTLALPRQSGVTHIRFDKITNYGDPTWIGLSEVRFGSGGPLTLDPTTTSNVGLDRATVSTSVNEPVDACTLYWDTIDRGANETGWAASANLGGKSAGQISSLLSGLSENTTYFFRFRVSSTALAAETWSAAGSFTTVIDSPDGPIITPASVTATNSLSSYPVIHTINSSGLNDSAANILDWTHDSTPANTNSKSWLGSIGSELIFTLPDASTVKTLYFWSYWGGINARSVTAFDISFSTDGVTYSTPSTITIATPFDGATEVFDLGTQANVTHVKFNNLRNGGDSLAGIGEVRFGGANSVPGDPFGNWAAGPWSGTLNDNSPDLDFDGGGLATGIEWVVGGDPTVGADDAGNAPTSDNSDATYFNFTFKRRDDAAADAGTAIRVEYGSELAGWRNTTDHGGADGVLIDDSTDLGGGFHQVTVSIPRSLASGGRLFARLQVTVAP